MNQESHTGRILEQLNIYWTESQDLRARTQALETQLAGLQRDRARLHHDYILECHEHAQTVAELSRLRDQFQRLSSMLSGEGKNPQSAVSVFFELEARSKSLQQAEHEICQNVGALKATCQSIEDRYCERRSQPNPPNPPNQGYRINHPRQYPPNNPIGSQQRTKSTTPARGK